MPPSDPGTASGASRFCNGWMVAAVILLAIIIAGGTYIWARQGRGRGLEITLEPDENFYGQISIGGEVNNPGLYPLRAGDTIENILEAAGGLTAAAEPGWLELTVVGADEAEYPQKVDINRAGAWLLAALPGIGEVRAQAIIDYRQQFGPFRDINELLQVPGMGDAVLEGIKDLITVTEQ